MKKIVAVMLVVLMAVLLMACEPKGPKISAVENTFNFGQIDQYESVTHVFVIKNDGDQNLEIKKVKTTCGCTAAKQKSNIVEPGKQTEIEVTFNAGPRSGEQKKKITVETNDPVTPRLELYIEGTVVVRLEANPRLIRILDVESGQEASGKVTLTNKSQEPVTISEFKYTDENVVKVELLADGQPVALPFKLAAGQSVEMSATVKMPADKKFLRTSIQVVTAEKPDKPISVNVVLRKKGTDQILKPGQAGQKIKKLVPGAGPSSMMAPGVKPSKPKKKPN